MRPPVTGLAAFGAPELRPQIAAPLPTDAELGWSPTDVARILDRCQAAARTIPPRRRPFVVLRVSADEVEVLERADLERHFRRHGLPQLARRVARATADLDRLLIYVEADEVGLYTVRVPT